MSAFCGECGVDFRLHSLLRRHLRRYRIDGDSLARRRAPDYGLHAHGNEFVECARCRHVFSSAYRQRVHARLCAPLPVPIVSFGD